MSGGAISAGLVSMPAGVVVVGVVLLLVGLIGSIRSIGVTVREGTLSGTVVVVVTG